MVPLDAAQTAKVEARLRERFTDEGPMLAKALAALFLERIRTGDKQAGEQDPPEDGMLGLAIDDYMGKVWPLVLSPSITTDEFRKAILDDADNLGPVRVAPSHPTFLRQVRRQRGSVDRPSGRARTMARVAIFRSQWRVRPAPKPRQLRVERRGLP